MSLDLTITPDGERDEVGLAFYANDCFDGYREDFPHWPHKEVVARAVAQALARQQAELTRFNVRAGRFLSAVVDHAARELATDGRMMPSEPDFIITNGRIA